MDTAKVVVIGGGVVGTSVAYHLVKKGWQDVVLCEQQEIGSGASALAVGNVILYTLDETVSKLNQYGVELYGKLEAETGFSPGFNPCGNLRLATDEDRLAEFHRYMAVAEASGVEAKLLTPEEVQELWPFMDVSGILAGIINPQDGYASGADMAQAFAAGARQGGATIKRHCEVTGIDAQADGSWLVQTSQGAIACEHVVSASGNFARRTAKMVGAEAQCVPVRHQYLITEPLEELKERRRLGLPDLPVTRDPNGSFYMRQEGECLLIGAYDGRGEAKFIDDVPAGHQTDLLPDELDKLLPYLEKAFERIPALESVGLAHVINYPMPYTPDDLPMTGPAFGLPNFWLVEGNPFGITLAAGVGWQLAEWMVEGEPSINMYSCDSTRYEGWASRKWAARKVEEAYEHTYLIPKPGEELPAGRCLRTSPLYDLLASKGATYGADTGWEVAKWFANNDIESEAQAIAQETQSLTEGVGVIDMTRLGYFVCSSDVAAQAFTAALPEIGRVTSLTIDGARQTDTASYQVMATVDGNMIFTCSAAREGHHLNKLCMAVPSDQRHTIANKTDAMGCLWLVGPQAESVLQQVIGDEMKLTEVTDNSLVNLTVGYASATVVRHNLNCTDTWQIWLPMPMVRHAYTALAEAGATDVGSLALANIEN